MVRAGLGAEGGVLRGSGPGAKSRRTPQAAEKELDAPAAAPRARCDERCRRPERIRNVRWVHRMSCRDDGNPICGPLVAEYAANWRRALRGALIADGDCANFRTRSRPTRAPGLRGKFQPTTGQQLARRSTPGGGKAGPGASSWKNAAHRGRTRTAVALRDHCVRCRVSGPSTCTAFRTGRCDVDPGTGNVASSSTWHVRIGVACSDSNGSWPPG